MNDNGSENDFSDDSIKDISDKTSSKIEFVSTFEGFAETDNLPGSPTFIAKAERELNKISC